MFALPDFSTTVASAGLWNTKDRLSRKGLFDAERLSILAYPVVTHSH